MGLRKINLIKTTSSVVCTAGDTGNAGQPVQQCSAVQAWVQVCGVGPRVQCNVSGGRIGNISQPAATVGLQRISS